MSQTKKTKKRFGTYVVYLLALPSWCNTIVSVKHVLHSARRYPFFLFFLIHIQFILNNYINI